MPAFDVLLPPLSRLVADRRLAHGPLAIWASRGDRLPVAASGREAQLAGVFRIDGLPTGRPWPVAALTRALDANDAEGALWLRADPAWLRADMLTVRMLACGVLGLDAAEAADLAQALKPLFGDVGMRLEVATPERWYLRIEPGVALPDFAPPEAVLGDDLAAHLPGGPEGRRWRALLNEAQVILHNHPVNAARIERGRVPANSLWFWGGGLLPRAVTTACTRILSDDVLIAALARRVGRERVALDPAAMDGPAGEGPVLLDLATTRDPDVLVAWIDALAARLRNGRIAGLHLAFESGERGAVQSAHRWRFWRRTRPLGA